MIVTINTGFDKKDLEKLSPQEVLKQHPKYVVQRENWRELFFIMVDFRLRHDFEYLKKQTKWLRLYVNIGQMDATRAADCHMLFAIVPFVKAYEYTKRGWAGIARALYRAGYVHPPNEGEQIGWLWVKHIRPWKRK